MIKKINHNNLDALALGAALLGSGGGSNPAHGKALAYKAISEYGDINLISVEDLEPDALVIPVSFMGAPLVDSVKKPTGKEFGYIMPFIEKYYGCKASALLAAEIGGSNAFSPLLCAGMIGCSIIDGDTIGRAFPEVHMTSCGLFGISNLPSFLSSVAGDVVMINALGELSLEKLTRNITISFGSKAAIISDIMSGAEAKKVVIRNTYTRAIQLGDVIITARNHGLNPAEVLVQKRLAQVVVFGAINELNRTIDAGFVVGNFSIKANEEKIVKVFFKNENLLVTCRDQVIVGTPDIIIPVERISGNPLTTEQLELGKEVALLVLDCDPLWKTEAGLKMVGLKVFGY